MESNIQMGYAEKVPKQEPSYWIKQWYIPDQPVVEPESQEKVKVNPSSTTKRPLLAVTNSLYDQLSFVLPVYQQIRLICNEMCKEFSD